ncbi:MAG TPA: tetratricopeptide repeat protein [Burkholderiales bacterium]|nr:tetratricopeptide repeat protein [Burkholderiales bacterium]
MGAAALACAVLPALASDVIEAQKAQARGLELHAQGEVAAALREFERATALAPQAPLAWHNRGLARRQLRDCEGAVADFTRALELAPKLFQAWYQRGNCRQVLGDYAAAVDDYTHALALPGQIHARFLAHFGRADAYRRLARLDEAHADYSRVLELRRDTTALRARAWVEAYRARWRQAHDDLARYLHETQAKEPDAAHAVIMAVLALERIGESGAPLLEQWQRFAAAAPWPAPVLRYLRGELSEEELLDAAQGDGERTEALAYAGSRRFARGDQAGAVTLWTRVLREGNPAFLEYDLAYHELRRLGAAQPDDRLRRGLP